MGKVIHQQEVKSMNNFDIALKKLQSIGQQHLLRYWEQLNVPQRTLLLDQIMSLDSETFKLQRQLILSPPSYHASSFESFADYQKSGSLSDFQLGKNLITQGKVGCLLVAGGQGTRLKWEGPKGTFPISAVKGKSLFQLFAEKIASASKQAQRSLPLAIMTSPQNDEHTRSFFYQHRFFGLLPDQVTFFSQKMLPLLDQKGNLFLDSPCHFSEGPDGNGGALKQFVEAGIWERWEKMGVECVIFTLIDNPLSDPFDAELVGFHYRQKSDITVKCTKKEDPKEKVGIVVKSKDQILVKEYFEIPSEEQSETLSNESLKHHCANLSLFCFSMGLIKEASKKNSKLPLHCALKTAHYLSGNGALVKPKEPMAWKYETFIFDVLQMTKKTSVLMYPREECFAPLKNAEGENSPQSVKDALLKSDRRIYSNLTKIKPPEDKIFELAPDFYYPTKELKKKWQECPLPNQDYIDP